MQTPILFTLFRASLLCLVTCVAVLAQTPFFADDFNAAPLPYNLTATSGSSWTTHSGTTNFIQATVPGLSYAGLTTAGGSATLTTTGEDVHRSFSAVANGAVYASFLVNVASAQAAGDYFFHFGGPAIGTTFNARIYLQSTGTGFRLGLTKANETDVRYTTATYNLNTTYLVVVKYSFVAGDANDQVSLFVEPALGAAEPTATVTTSSTTTDLNSIGTVALRQGTAANAPGLRLDYLRVGNSWAAVTARTAISGFISATPNSLTLNPTFQGVRTEWRSLTVTSANVTGPLTVSALSPHIELSQTIPGGFLPQALSLPANTTSVVYARVASTAPVGAFIGSIVVMNAAAPTVTVAVSASVAPQAFVPLTTSVAYFQNLTTVQGVPSAVRAYTVSGGTGNPTILVQAPAGAEVSLSATTGFVSSLSLNSAPASNTLSPTTIYVRLTGNSPLGTYFNSVTNVAGVIAFPIPNAGLIGPAEAYSSPIDLYGTILANTTAVTPIATARTLPLNTVATIEGRVTVSDQFGGKLFYIQDATGGIAVFDNNVAYGAQVNLGDLVLVRGPVDLFRGKREINGVQSFTRITAGTIADVPAPVLTAISQLSANEGRLVSIRDVAIGGSGQVFVGNTNYPISNTSGTAELRIDPASTALIGLSKVTTTSLLTGVSDRFTSGATDLVQVLPRIQPDIPGAVTVALTDVLCPGPGVIPSTTLTADQTFDFATLNTEFFGADSGTLLCGTRRLNYDDKGPANETLQAQNLISTLRRLNTDLVTLQEVSDARLLANAVSTSLSGYSLVCSDRFSFFFQDQCAQTVTVSGSTSTVFGPTVLSQKVCVLYRTATVSPVWNESGPMLTDLFNYPGSNAWASGRLPYLFVANVTIGGVTRKLHVVNLHALSGSGSSDYARRTEDFRVLKERLDSWYPRANLIIAGDYNDRTVGSIAAGQPSSVWRFDALPATTNPNAPGPTDNPDYDILTKTPDALGCSSFGANGSMIDHITVSNEVFPAYIPGTVGVVTPGILDYFNTTSDHSPVVARFDLARMSAGTSTGGPLTLLTPTYNCTTAAISFNVIGGDGSPVTFFAPGITRASISSPNGILEPGLRFDPKTLFISATQNGTTVSQTFDYVAYCANRTGNLRVATSELVDGLTVTVLGNPTQKEMVEVLIGNRNGEVVTLRISDEQGRSISQSTTPTDRATVRLGSSPGVYLLRVSAGTREVVTKILRQ